MKNFKESHIEENQMKQLIELKYIYCSDIVDRKTLEQNFKAKFELLNRVQLSDNEFLRLREEIIGLDVFEASKKLCERQYFQREDGNHFTYEFNVFRLTSQEGKKDEVLLKNYRVHRGYFENQRNLI